MAGGTGEGMAMQTTNGVRYKSWNFGIGTGIDWYGVRSIPLIADVRRCFTNKKYKPFVYTNAGVNFPWESGGTQFTGSLFETQTNYEPAFCGEFGVGYKVSFKNQTAFVMSAGFSYKEIRVEQTSSTGIPGFGKTTNFYEYYYRRIAVRMGINF